MKTKLNKLWRKDLALTKVVSALESDGRQVYLVGGCVRNVILGKKIRDIDLATELLPDEVIRKAETNGFGVVLTGRSHGTVTILYSGRKFEVTTFRQDTKTDGRKAEVAFTSNIQLDARRRDFTMNSIYMKLNGEIIDPLDALSDLLSKKVRFIGDPLERIKEDRLRILRYFRFRAEFSLSSDLVDVEVRKAIFQQRSRIKFLSKERIWVEVSRILLAPKPQETFESLVEMKLLEEVFPKIDIEALKKVVQLEEFYSIEPSLLNRLFSLNKTLGGNWSNYVSIKAAERKILEKIRDSVENHSDLMLVAYKYGKSVAESWLMNSDSKLILIEKKLAKKTIGTAANASFPLRGKDLLNKFKRGPDIGKKLTQLESVWLKSNFKLTKRDLLKYL